MIIFAITPLSGKVMKQTSTTVQPKPVPVINEPVNIQPTIQPIQPVVPRFIVEEYSLVPTNENTLKNLGLCPLFERKETVFPHCFVQLGTYGNWNRILMQLKTLDQFELADKTGLSPAMCGGLSLNNGRLIRDYAYTGNQENLRKLHDINDATNFLLNLEIGDWINATVLRNNIAKVEELGIDGVNVSAVSTVALFDSNLRQTATFAAVFDEDEFVYVQRVKKNIQEGLKKDNYFHIMIIGNEETISGKGLGHYFCFAIMKVGNQIQYIVLDTLPRAYHLREGSHERDRLMFVIQNIEQGHSSIKITNIQVNNYLELLEEERVAEEKKKSLR